MDTVCLRGSISISATVQKDTWRLPLPAVVLLWPECLYWEAFAVSQTFRMEWSSSPNTKELFTPTHTHKYFWWFISRKVVKHIYSKNRKSDAFLKHLMAPISVSNKKKQHFILHNIWKRILYTLEICSKRRFETVRLCTVFTVRQWTSLHSVSKCFQVESLRGWSGWRLSDDAHTERRRQQSDLIQTCGWAPHYNRLFIHIQQLQLSLGGAHGGQSPRDNQVLVISTSCTVLWTCSV